MARGNQRDKAREKNLKEQAGKVRLTAISNSTLLSWLLEKYHSLTRSIERQEHCMCIREMLAIGALRDVG
jgi:glycerol kinase